MTDDTDAHIANLRQWGHEWAADEIEALRARAEAAEDRAYRLAYAIAGGEDAPGYLDSQPVAQFSDNLRKEREAAEAKLEGAKKLKSQT